jgi:hypothetical protein
MRAMGAMGVMRAMGIPMAAEENSRGIFIAMAMKDDAWIPILKKDEFPCLCQPSGSPLLA